MSDTDVLDRLAELEARTGRMILAGDARDQNGWGALNNWIEGRLAEERSFEREVVSQALAMLRDEILTMTKTMVESSKPRASRSSINPPTVASRMGRTVFMPVSRLE